MVDAFVSFLNQEAAALAALPTLPKGALQGHLRDRLAETFAFPLRLQLRCLIVGERHVDAGGEDVRLVQREGRALELVPEGLTREAAALSGPFLWRTDRPLQEGSVVLAAFEVEDPRLRESGQPALHGRVLDATVEVAVEP